VTRFIFASGSISLLHVCGLASETIAAQPHTVPQEKIASQRPDEAKVRRFIFQYRVRINGLKPTNNGTPILARVWMPCPPSNDYQKVTRLPATAPAELKEYEEARYGNRILFFETQAPANGDFIVDVPYEVARYEVLRRDSRSRQWQGERFSELERAKYLSADRLVPTTGKTLQLLDTVNLEEDKLDLAHQLYDIVDEHVTYKKEGTGWGRGDSDCVCDSRYGNCSDFHSLFMSLARSQGMPARFEIGFSIPSDKAEGPIAGYHCWAWCYLDDRGWIPVDISEADKHPEMEQ
jgi:transglutaminase-like putative cysteine protease